MLKQINITLFFIASILLFSMCKKNSTTTNNTNNSTNNNTSSAYYSVLNIYGSQYVNGNALTTLGVNSGPVFFQVCP